MKKLLVCLFALCTLTFTSCNPDPEPINYADDFVGEYVTSISAAWVCASAGIAIEDDLIDGLLCKIEETYNNNVVLKMYQGSTLVCYINGYCDQSGLFLKDFEFTYSIATYIQDLGDMTMSFDLELGGTKVNGNSDLSWTSPIVSGSTSATVENVTVDMGSVVGSTTFSLTKI